jgi:intraflagellar transport protein 140
MISINDHPLGQINTEDSFTCLDFNFRKRILVVGGLSGKVYMWKCTLTSNIIPVSSECWEPYCVVESIPDIVGISWSNYMGLIHVYSKKHKHAMLNETILQKKMNEFMKILQTSQDNIELITLVNDQYISNKVQLDHNVHGISIYKNMLLCWNGMSVYLYEIDQNTLRMSLSSELSLKSNIMAINNDSIINANNKNIELYTYDGEKKDQIPIKYDYGDISLFNVAHKFLLVVTVNNYFAVYDLERRGLKQTLSFRKFEKNGQSLGEIREAAINCKGNLIIFLTDNMINSEMRIPETKLIIYDVEMDSYIDYEISPNRIPIEITWDYSDWRIFAISTEYAKDLGEEDEKKDLYKSIIYTRNDDDNSVAQQNADWVGGELFLLFYTSENGVNSLESHKISRENQGIFGLQAPDIYFISSTPDPITKCSLTEKKMQFFQGLDKINEEISKALIEFSLLMSCGKLDEAYKIVKNIKTTNIWENMAHICIKTKRLDVLEVCLSNMRFERGIKAFREARHEKEPEAKLAKVAMHLNLIDEAKKLLQEVNRWDVLIKFYICIGDFDKAIQTAKDNDRIDLHNTYYRIAQHYEKIGDIEQAIQYYKLSGSGNKEIPRMLISLNNIEKLEQTLSEDGNPESLLRLASYYESQEDYEDAMEYYKKADDIQNVIRLYLKENKIDDAIKVYEDGKEKYKIKKEQKYLRGYMDGAYLIGNFYEKNNSIKNAIDFYRVSGRYNQAFRLAKEKGLDEEIYSLGTQAPKHTQNLIAEYFEKKNKLDKAIKLYIQGSNIRKGLNLCLATNRLDEVRNLSRQLESKQDKDTLKALAEYFTGQNEFEKALELLIRIKDYENSMKICENHKVRISQETANAMKADLENEKDNKTKQELTSRLAKLLMNQGDFEMAHDIYVKMGNLKKAMKCYIKMGDKNKVIEFAHMCRNPELFILAANFLQNLDWTPDVVKIIVSFFNKAKAYYNLCQFYIVLGVSEINEKKNFKNGEEYLRNALKTVMKVRENDDKKNNKIEEIKKKLGFIESLNDMNEKLQSGNAAGALEKCNELLRIDGRDDILGDKDIYGFMFKIHYFQKDYQNAFLVLEQCRVNQKLTNIVPVNLIQEVLTNVGRENQLQLYVK